MPILIVVNEMNVVDDENHRASTLTAVSDGHFLELGQCPFNVKSRSSFSRILALEQTCKAVL
jgi:hypothetical protein